MMWLVRYWYINVPEHREGGPWWEKTFWNWYEAMSFYNLMREFCHKIESPRQVPDPQRLLSLADIGEQI